MRLALLGGGGFRVPLVYRTLMQDRSETRVTEIRLYDVDQQRQSVMLKILEALGAQTDDPPRLFVCQDVAEAVAGVDFVFSAIRVGGTHERALDEGLAHDRGILGQETTGFGGISYALRGIPVALDIARTIADVNPGAWLINFTNPAGIITEATTAVLGDRVIGICDSPIGLARRVLTTLEVAGLVPAGTTQDVGTGAGAVRLDYAGLNHLGWLQGIDVAGENVLPRLFARPDLIEGFEEGRLFGASWIQTLGCVPNEYLHYYYYSRDTEQADAHTPATRGIFLDTQQSEFYAAASGVAPTEAAHLWEQTRRNREETYMATNREAAGGMERDEQDLESGGYDKVALAIMHAIGGDQNAQLILNVPNRGTIAGLPDDAVVEVPCVVDAQGAHPLPVSPLPGHARGLVQTVKYVERSVIRAAVEQDRDLAIEALALHPLVDGVTVARGVLDDAVRTFPELSYLA